jgi:surface protein
LTALPDISKWNTSNVTNMSYMFYGCKSLTTLPKIDKWNTSKLVDMDGMFSECDPSLVVPSKFKKE